MTLKTAQRITALVIIATIILLLLYDTAVGLIGGTNATISWVVLQAAHKYLAIPLFSGLLLGHLFLGQTSAVTNED